MAGREKLFGVKLYVPVPELPYLVKKVRYRIKRYNATRNIFLRTGIYSLTSVTLERMLT